MALCNPDQPASCLLFCFAIHRLAHYSVVDAKGYLNCVSGYTVPCLRQQANRSGYQEKVGEGERSSPNLTTKVLSEIDIGVNKRTFQVWLDIIGDGFILLLQ